MDATLQTLKRFADPTQWEVVPNVPIFTVHRVVKRGADGQPAPIDVSEADLRAIVQTARRQERESAVCPRITQGHMHLPRETPEAQQPAPIGYGRNLRVAPWGPAGKPGVLCDLWFEKGKKPARGDFPYRSVEYYPDSHEITGIALLRRDPELDLGLVTYERGAPAFCYSRETDMAEATATPPAAEADKPLDPTAQPDATAPDPEFQEHFMRCMKHSYPHMDAMHGAAAKQYEAAAAPASLSGTNGAMPAPVKPGEEEQAETYMRRQYPQLYSRWQADRGLAAQALSRLNVLQYKDELRQLREDGYPIDVDEEIKECGDKTPEQFARYKTTLLRHYARQQGPAQYSSIDLPISSTGRQPAQMDGARFEKALAYQREKNCSWDEAERHAQAN